MTFATSNFLIPNGTLVVEFVAFLIVLAFLGRYVLPFLRSALDERAERIGAELSAADQARAEAARADDERKQALEAARLQAREILAQANHTAEQVAAEAQGRAEAEYERIVTSATAEVELARQRAVEQASAQLGNLVLGVVERIIGREADADVHRDLIEGAVEALRQGAGSTGAAAGAGATP